MTTYYISPNGNDSNNGLGPDASHASNKPFLTLGKVLVTGSPLSAGDIVYVAPGYYYSAGNYTVLSSISSVGSPTQIIGDPTNAQGFKDSGGVRLSAGIPWLTTRTSGEGLDSPIASTSNFFNATTNDPSGLQFKQLALEVLITSQTIWSCDSHAGSDILFQDCYLIGNNIILVSAGTAGTAGRNITIDRCTLFCNNVYSNSSTTAAATADADLNIRVTNNLIYGKLWSGSCALSASGGNLAGGLYFYNNVNITPGTAATAAGKISTTTPIKVGSNTFFSNGSVLNAGTSGQIVDDGYNRIFNFTSTAAYTNVTQAGTSFLGVVPNIVLPHLVKWGLEMPRADMFGWTDAAHANQKFSASGITTSDFTNKTARPWGAGASIGCFQAQDVTQDTSSAISGGGTNSVKLTGAGEVSIFLPVDAVPTTVSVRSKSTSYGGTNYPQLIVVANPGVGITSNTTVTAADANEATITTASFTPTSKGVMEVRLVSRSSSTTSTTHFDIVRSRPNSTTNADYWFGGRPFIRGAQIMANARLHAIDVGVTG